MGREGRRTGPDRFPLERLSSQLACPEPLSPRLTDDPLTGGESLDFVKITADSTMGDELFRLAEAEGTFCGYYKAVDRHRAPFGEPPVVCNYFYHEEITKSAKKGK